jgi:hypothetical protein
MPARQRHVPPAVVLRLPACLITKLTWLRCLQPGKCHGVGWIDNADDERDASRIVVVGSNGVIRTRMEALAVLLGWVANRWDDTQYLGGGPPHLVWSTDHGMPAHFIPIWPHVRREGEWQGFGLRPHAAITRALRSDEYASPHEVSEIREPASRLATVSDEQIASAVAAAPDEWRTGLELRLAFMRYLQRRRGELTFKCLDALAKRSQRTNRAHL